MIHFYNPDRTFIKSISRREISRYNHSPAVALTTETVTNQQTWPRATERDNMPYAHTYNLSNRKKSRKHQGYSVISRDGEHWEDHYWIIMEGDDWILIHQKDSDGRPKYFHWDGWNWKDEAGTIWAVIGWDKLHLLPQECGFTFNPLPTRPTSEEMAEAAEVELANFE